MKILLFLFMASPALAVCKTADVLEQIRPGAEWIINDNDYSSLRWLDSSLTKPSLSEIQAAIPSCNTKQEEKKQKKEAGKLVFSDKTKPVGQRLDALVDYLGLE